MTGWTHTHLLFCEGPHDVVFLNRVLKTCLGFKQKNLLISELPYPVRDVLTQSFKNRAADDLRLDLAKKFFLPDRVLVRDGVLVLLFNYGGSNRAQSMPPFLANLFTLLQATAFSGGSQVPLSYAVFADADASGTDAARQSICDDLQQIDGQDWLKPQWTVMADLPTAAEQHTQQGRVGAYIWRSLNADQGTLEDIVRECLGELPGFDQTLAFVDTRFDWTPAASATPSQLCKLTADRQKAAFCIEGQREKPGGSLGVVLDQTKLLTAERLSASPSVQRCVDFLRRWLLNDSTSTAPGITP